MALNPNPKRIFLAWISLVRNGPIRNEFFYFKTFGHFDQTLLEVIEDSESESAAHFLSRGFIGRKPILLTLDFLLF